MRNLMWNKFHDHIELGQYDEAMMLLSVIERYEEVAPLDEPDK